MTVNRIWLRITDSRNIPVREGRSVVAGGHEIAIFNLGGRFLAVESRCPHRGGPLADGIVSGTTVVCPLHGWRVSLDAGKVSSPIANSAPRCLQTFATRVEDGIVSVEIPIESAPMTGELGVCAGDGVLPGSDPKRLRTQETVTDIGA